MDMGVVRPSDDDQVPWTLPGLFKGLYPRESESLSPLSEDIPPNLGFRNTRCEDSGNQGRFQKGARGTWANVFLAS